MSIDYLKTNSEEVYRVLDDIIVGGFKLRDKLIQDNGKIDGVPSSEMIMEWRKDYAYWYERSVTHLKNIYKSERQSLTFLHKSGTQLNVPGRHQECTDIICKIDVKIILIEEYIKLLENRFPIVFKAMRDNNIQIGGENNKQTVSNER